MPARRDALLGAARLVEAVNATALRHKGAVGTVGVLEVKPASTNVIPGETYLTIDCRDPDEAVLDRMEQDIGAAAEAIASELGLQVTFKNIVKQPPVHFDPQCIEAVRRAAASAGLSTRDIMSGAGHDAAYVARVAPTTMIFVPCKGGISHNEAEYSSKEQCANGAQVLLQAVLDYDRTLAEKFS